MYLQDLYKRCITLKCKGLGIENSQNKFGINIRNVYGRRLYWVLVEVVDSTLKKTKWRVYYETQNELTKVQQLDIAISLDDSDSFIFYEKDPIDLVHLIKKLKQ